jgi:hypothetical protein
MNEDPEQWQDFPHIVDWVSQMNAESMRLSLARITPTMSIPLKTWCSVAV